eukprot:TRINITY_DN3887_c0_g1_i1.p1 TRINITY_DN3887_c0_g1~~TRINITY_DN3887_c0_g1_i1.p1  ORF type:complete len:724 (+),score=129.13 TRINITY_DN3887_c0_g1_i1:54-2174(+)
MGCCCGDSEEEGTVVKTYAGDNREPSEMGLAGVTIENRSRICIPTDLPMCLVFVAFWVGMIVVASVGFERGDPLRLIYGTDYLGNRCGGSTVPPGWAEAVNRYGSDTRFKYQSSNWEENKKLWMPAPYDGTDLTAESMTEWNARTSLGAGVCVKTCPQYGSTLTAEEIKKDPAAYNQMNMVFTYGESLTDKPPAYHRVWYNSADTQRRCLPDSSSEAISYLLTKPIDELPGVTRLENFFTRSLADIADAYTVLIIAGIIALFLPFFYIILLRCILKPMVWTVLIAILVFFGVFGYLCFRKYDDLHNNSSTGDDDDAKGWLVLALVTWVVGALYLCFLCWFWKKINAACDIIQEAGKVLLSDPSIMLVPIITFALVACLLCWVVYVSLYLWTIEDDDEVVLDSGNYGNVSYTLPKEVTSKNNLLYYNIFGWFWTMGLFSALGYFVVAAATVQWYYSHVEDDSKSLPCITGWGRGYFWGIFYHLGGLVTGALIIAIVQFARFMLQHLTYQMQKSSYCACLVCLIDCCLACLERFLQYISRNAYIVAAIEGSGFWPSCCMAISILIGSLEYLAPLILVSDVVFFIGKLAITAANVTICYFFVLDSELAPEVENGILVLIVVGMLTYIVASIFMQLYEAAIDSMFMLVFHENSQPKDPSLFFCPAKVFKIVTGKEKKDAGLFRDDHRGKAEEYKAKKQRKKSSAAPDSER